MYDDPDTHAELAKVLFRLQETTGEIDKATVDPKMRKLIETTWQIQDRMIFEDQVFSIRGKACFTCSANST